MKDHAVGRQGRRNVQLGCAKSLIAGRGDSNGCSTVEHGRGAPRSIKEDEVNPGSHVAIEHNGCACRDGQGLSSIDRLTRGNGVPCQRGGPGQVHHSIVGLVTGAGGYRSSQIDGLGIDDQVTVGQGESGSNRDGIGSALCVDRQSVESARNRRNIHLYRVIIDLGHPGEGLNGRRIGSVFDPNHIARLGNGDGIIRGTAIGVGKGNHAVDHRDFAVRSANDACCLTGNDKGVRILIRIVARDGNRRRFRTGARRIEANRECCTGLSGDGGCKRLRDAEIRRVAGDRDDQPGQILANRSVILNREGMNYYGISYRGSTEIGIVSSFRRDVSSFD